MIRKLSICVAAAVFAVAGPWHVPPAQAETSGVKVGMLTCNVDSGWGLVFGSSRSLRCVYNNSHSLEHYTGNVNKYGVDIGYTAGSVIVWTVFAPTADIGKGALAGKYGGVTGGAAVGVGAGANVLVGGSNQSVTLQPVSIEGNSGLNVAAGIAGVTLEASP